MTSPSSAPGIPLYVPSFPSLFNQRSNVQNDVEEEDAYANDDGRDAFLLAGLRRPGPADPYNPYAEPSGPSSMPEDQYGPAIDPIFEKLLPTEEAPSNFYVEPHRRKPQDVVFTVLFLLALSAMYIVGIAYLSTTKSGSGDGVRKTIYETLRNSVPLIATATCIAVGGGALWLLLFGRYVRQIMYLSVILIPVLFITLFVVTFTNSIVRKFYDAPFLGPQYSGMIGMSFVFLISGLMSGFFVYRKRQQVEQTIDIIELSFAILRYNPRIFLLSIVLMIGYAIFSLTWILMFARLFLKGYFKVDPTGGGGHWEVTGGTGWAATFFILVYFWTSANFHNVEKVTIAGVVGEWFFASGETEDGARSDRTLKHLKVALTTSFGSICFASLILGIVETSQFLLRQARKRLPERTSSLTGLFAACLSIISSVLSQISSYALVYCSLTGTAFLPSAHACTRIFRRNLILGLATAALTRLVLTLGTLMVAAVSGVVCFFLTSTREGGSPYAWMVGCLGVLIPYYVVRFLARVVQNTVDATFICYLIDLDTNSCHSEVAHNIFRKSIV